MNHSKTRDYIFNYDNKNIPNTFYIDKYDSDYKIQEYGFNNILVFKGGWKTWSESGLDIEYNE